MNSLFVKQHAQIVLLQLVFVGLISSAAGAESIQYPQVSANVTFADVLALEYAEADVKLAYGSEQPELQSGLLWLPATANAAQRDSAQKLPLLIFIHGGCWLNSFDVSHTFAFSTGLAQAGYAVWSLEYRRTGDAGGGWLGTFDDVLAGIQWRANLQDYPIATDNYVIMGHSAGGHLALLAGTRSSEARAVIGLAAIADLVQYAQAEGTCQAAANSFMGTDPASDPELFTQANPAQLQLHNKSYLLEGTADEIVPMSATPIAGTSQLLANDAGHFDWVHPGTPAFAQLLQLLATVFSP